MWIIRKVRIKNFRSIVYGEFEPGNISLIVGENDVGKSNYLRALNLFFNNETDVGKKFNFLSDFSMNAAIGKGKARQIEISVYVDPPDSFADKSQILWKRYWREESQSHTAESFHRLPGRKDIPLKSKAIQWLRRIRFRYVPAIKGSDYFTSLLRDLHDVLAETVDSELRSASTDFIGVVREHTAGISEHLIGSINLQSKLELPVNLRSLFEVLDFSTTNGNASISLQLRGDGIKVRHIPAILTFLADQERKLAPSGKPRPTAIWGYEEPENNLEMKRAFEHAEELRLANSVAQIFITTHSPAFYNLASSDSENIWAFQASSDAQSGTQLSRVESSLVSDFDIHLGLMPIVAPYIAEKIEELSAIKTDFAKLKESILMNTKPLILLSGETDQKYLSVAFNHYYPDMSIEVLCVGKKTQKGSVGAGDSKLISLIDYWNIRPELLTRKVCIVLDNDVKKLPVSQNSNLHIFQLPTNHHNKVASIGIENLLPPDVFLEKFYSQTSTDLAYGGTKVVTLLNKVALCDAICAGEFVIEDTQENLITIFKEVVDSICDFFLVKAQLMHQ
jgi:hypothetical protein